MLTVLLHLPPVPFPSLVSFQLSGSEEGPLANDATEGLDWKRGKMKISYRTLLCVTVDNAFAFETKAAAGGCIIKKVAASVTRATTTTTTERHSSNLNPPSLHCVLPLRLKWKFFSPKVLFSPAPGRAHIQPRPLLPPLFFSLSSPNPICRRETSKMKATISHTFPSPHTRQ